MKEARAKQLKLIGGAMVIALLIGVPSALHLQKQRTQKSGRDIFNVPIKKLAPVATPMGGKPSWLPPSPVRPLSTELWMNGIGAKVRENYVQHPETSNTRRADYAGPESCKECHEEKYAAWEKHAHRRMNLPADASSVLGDFSGEKGIEYMGGKASFLQEEGKYLMHLEKEGQVRRYEVRRTIGSRFHQYYTGILTEGPEVPEHVVRNVEHVLPFGYQMDRGEWVPVVHVHGFSNVDEFRDDPFFDVLTNPYNRMCSMCHTTVPTGTLLARKSGAERFEAWSPHDLAFDYSEYVADEHPEQVGLTQKDPVETYKAQSTAIAEASPAHFGITCEACHHGLQYHVDDEEAKPLFYPAGKSVHVKSPHPEKVWDRSAANINFICSRCHSGGRPQYANGISTWNSTEFSDAMRGACYLHPGDMPMADKKHLTCVHCHDPHETIGPRWTPTMAEDNAKCIACHQSFSTPDALQAHTHHVPTSTGSACMNCHMPKINEGILDLVRTHTIFSPTDPKMLGRKQPNACNMCHVEKSAAWTVDLLNQWYGTKLPVPAGDTPAAIEWMSSTHEATRMVGADVLIKAEAAWASENVLKVLNDPYLINRQFTQYRLEAFTNLDFKAAGYRFYDQPEQREPAIEALRAQLKAR